MKHTKLMVKFILNNKEFAQSIILIAILVFYLVEMKTELVNTILKKFLSQCKVLKDLPK
jgi:hypothetical protein